MRAAIIGPMATAPLRSRPAPAGLALLRWLADAWRRILFGASVVVLALSPSSYRDARMRTALAWHSWMDTAPILPGFTVLSALLTVVITRIVVVTATSYGLTQYALEMVVRVLVLELLPADRRPVRRVALHDPERRRARRAARPGPR